MKTFLRIVAGLVVFGIVALLAFIFVPVQRTAPAQALAADWQAAVGQGEYVMRAGDCVACHSADGGAFLAGGSPIESPLGKIWSRNITPDVKTGIGGWSLDEFRAVMIDGIRPNGTHLYPAMPYENYRLMHEEDIAALYDYLMNEVEPVNNTVKETELSFPLNLRWGIRAWNWLALTHGPGFVVAGASDMQDRGQYLVEGPGHCAACHSPRTVFMTQDGVMHGEENFLAGGVINDWNAHALAGSGSVVSDWTVAETAEFLATGRNTHAAANGEMGLVVEHSLQYLTDEDNIAIAAYLKGEDGAATRILDTDALYVSLPQEPADEAGLATAEMLTEASPDINLGARLYLDNCSACHFVTGQGGPQIFPPLAGNPLVTGTQTTPLISIILHGGELPSTQLRPMHLVMQGYADRLDDAEVAELASFLRSAWGNDASTVSSPEVAAVRASGAEH